MTAEYSAETCKTLEQSFHDAQVHRPLRIRRYEAGTELTYEIAGIEQPDEGTVRLVVEQFVGGGFAGQVYKVGLTKIENGSGRVAGLQVGKQYAMKILLPPSNFSRLFRSLLYWIGFQGPFQPQVNPAAARAGALWQKFIRRGAEIRFGDESSVVDIYATFIDKNLGSCGELSEWVDGRTWQLEVDDRLDLLRLWQKGRQVAAGELGSPEYRAKKEFMAEFVKLLGDMGAYEFARQYEWWTCKSQPNCLKRTDTEQNPQAGLAAVDFRAGLALLPFLPMSPGDFKLILAGILRGSLVQFDRGSLSRLERFVDTHGEKFSGMSDMLAELKAAEQIYRNSIPDVTHNHVKLLYSAGLWRTMFESAVTGWRVRNFIDDKWQKRLSAGRILTLVFLLIGAVPFLGRFVRRIWARDDWRRHYAALLTSRGYLFRAVKAAVSEKLIVWHRSGRVGSRRALNLAERPWRCLLHLPLLILPAGLHRFGTDKDFRKEKLAYIFVRPFKLYFNRQLREQWLCDMVTEGRRKHILTGEDADAILSQIKEPFIQKYLVSLVVHLLTLPITQIVSVAIAVVYWITHWGQPHAFEIGLGIIGIFQVVPISPGSLVRGFYVLYLVIRDRDFKDYNIAVFLGFFKYIGYLAFPIQMTYHYPALARFMAAHWATEAVHIVPVFGERGALLEHWVFCLFYNWPLTIRRRVKKRAQLRAQLKPRYWHIGLYAVAAAAVFAVADLAYIAVTGRLPSLRDIWWLVLLVPLLCGTLTTLGCGGARLYKRIIAATVCGIVVGLLYITASTILSNITGTAAGITAKNWGWRIFNFAIFSTIGAIVTELKLPDPDLRRAGGGAKSAKRRGGI